MRKYLIVDKPTKDQKYFSLHAVAMEVDFTAEEFEIIADMKIGEIWQDNQWFIVTRVE